MTEKQRFDTFERGEAYERYIGRWSRQVAPRFLAWLNSPASGRWLDVGCGTGALCAAIFEQGAPAQVTGIEPSAGFLRSARANLAGRAALARATGTAIPLAAASVDALVSGLVLNFIPDPAAALREMMRVTRPGGLIGAYVWDYGGKMELLRYFWDAAGALDPAAAQLNEGSRFPICQPGGLAAFFSAAGLVGVESSAIDLPTPFASFEDYWQPFLGGQGPGPAYVMSLDEAARQRLRDHLHERLPSQPDGSINLIARAWTARGVVLPGSP